MPQGMELQRVYRQVEAMSWGQAILQGVVLGLVCQQVEVVSWVQKLPLEPELELGRICIR